MSTINSGSNFLAVVGGAAVTIGMLGVHLAQAFVSPTPANHLLPRPTQVISTPTSVPSVHTQPHTPVANTPASSRITHVVIPATVTVPATPVPATAIPAATAQAQVTAVSSDQTTYSNQTPPFHFTYPVNWNASTTNNSYNVVSPDMNAAVGIYLEDSSDIDTTALQEALIAKLPTFLQLYGGAATGNPVYQQVSVDGIPAIVSGFPVAKNGQAGYASVSATYYQGVIYYIWGLVADQSAYGASGEITMVSSIMNSFHIL